MMRFGVLFLFLILNGIIQVSQVSAKQQDFNKPASIKYSKKDIFDIDSQIKRTSFDKKVDKLIEEHLGKRYRRANSHDLYPLELPKKLAKRLDSREEIDMMEFYNYSRKGLEKISGSKLLKAYVYNFDGDERAFRDYAVIVWDTKKKRPYLAVLNQNKELYFEKFNATYLEPINEGLFPTEVVYKDNKTRFVNNPALRVVSFEEESYIFFFDAQKKKWQELYLD